MNTRTVQPIETSLNAIGISNWDQLNVNLSYDELFSHELNESDPRAKAVQSSGAITIDTGKFTGRSPKDKYIVKNSESTDNIWWNEQGSDNKPITSDTWSSLNR